MGDRPMTDQKSSDPYRFALGLDLLGATPKHWIAVLHKNEIICARGNFDSFDEANLWGRQVVEDHKRVTRVTATVSPPSPDLVRAVADLVLSEIAETLSEFPDRLVAKRPPAEGDR